MAKNKSRKRGAARKARKLQARKQHQERRARAAARPCPPVHMPEQLAWINETARAAEWPYDTAPPIAIYVDEGRRWVVQVWRSGGAQGTQYAGSLRVGIRAAARPATADDPNPPPANILATWDQVQAIKNTWWPHRLAVEVYPPRHQVVNAAPMRWLWILPAGASLPFNLADDQPGGAPITSNPDDPPEGDEWPGAGPAQRGLDDELPQAHDHRGPGSLEAHNQATVGRGRD